MTVGCRYCRVSDLSHPTSVGKESWDSNVIKLIADSGYHFCQEDKSTACMYARRLPSSCPVVAPYLLSFPAQVFSRGQPARARRCFSIATVPAHSQETVQGSCSTRARRGGSDMRACVLTRIPHQSWSWAWVLLLESPWDYYGKLGFRYHSGEMRFFPLVNVIVKSQGWSTHFFQISTW